MNNIEIKDYENTFDKDENCNYKEYNHIAEMIKNIKEIYNTISYSEKYLDINSMDIDNRYSFVIEDSNQDILQIEVLWFSIESIENAINWYGYHWAEAAKNKDEFTLDIIDKNNFIIKIKEVIEDLDKEDQPFKKINKLIELNKTIKE